MPAKDEAIAILPGLSPIHGRAIEARFDSAMMSSDGGLLVLREIEQRLGIAKRLAACIRDPRTPERIVARGTQLCLVAAAELAGAGETSLTENELPDDLVTGLRATIISLL